MTTQKPVNQKSIYHSFGTLYEKLMNDEISLEKAETGAKMLSGMNQTYALEIKRAEVENMIKEQMQPPVSLRTIEMKDFDELPITKRQEMRQMTSQEIKEAEAEATPEDKETNWLVKH